MHRFRTMLRSPAGEAPEGSGTAPATAAGQTALPLQPAESAAPPQAAPPAPPPIDPSHPELRKLIAAAAKDAATKAAADERAKIEEEARLAKLDAESRAKAEAKKAEDAAAAAKAEAEQHKTAAEFARELAQLVITAMPENAEYLYSMCVRVEDTHLLSEAMATLISA